MAPKDPTLTATFTRRGKAFSRESDAKPSRVGIETFTRKAVFPTSVDKIEGKIMRTEHIELSSDLKTLTRTVRPVGQREPNIFVFERQ